MPDAAVAFDLCGAGLGVVAARRSWTDSFDAAFGRFRTNAAADGAFRLVIAESDEPAIPPGVPMTWEGEFVEKRAGRIYETDAVEIIEMVGHGHVAIDHAAARAEAIMKPGSETALSFTPMMNILDAALKAAGMNLLHAACLTVPDGSGAVAICAPSGLGKTTTSLALARSGFGLASDDASVIGRRTGGFAIWGLPRKLKVHRRTAAMMPWIGALPDSWSEDDEQALTLDSLRGVIAIAEPSPLPLKAVVLLGQRSHDGHRLVQLSKAEALVRIAQDNVSKSATGVQARNRRHFETVAAMVRSAPVLQLHAGTAMDALPEALDAALLRIADG